MTRTSIGLRTSLWALLLFTFNPLGTLYGSAEEASASRPGDALRSLLNQGAQLEQHQRWGDALTHYEDALRNFPQEPDLVRRFDAAKTHYDVTRRASDASFQTAVTTLDPAAALDLYSEVLLKVQTHYVDSPEWNRLVARGVAGLDTALAEPSFRQRHLPNVAPQRVDMLRQEMWRRVGGQVIRSRQEARAAVERVAAVCAQYTGLGATPVVMECVCGATNALDDYSAFLTGDQLGDVYSQIDGNFVGLGVELKAAEGALRVVRVIPESPAQRGGLTEGDLIVAVDRQETRTLDTDTAANLLQGPPGSEVEITVLDASGRKRPLRMTREQVEVPSIDESRIIDPQLGVAYLRLTSFQKTTTRELDSTLWQLHRSGMRWLVIDLRGNPGGLLTAAVEAADRFIEQGLIVSTHGRNAGENFSYPAHRTGTWNVPLAVLIDGESASASEIFAGAIRDHARGTIIGARSFGKGSVQGIFPLSRGNSGLRLTTAKFYSPQGRAFSHVGVEPHVTVAQVARPTIPDDATPEVNAVRGSALGTQATDPALEAALQVARGQLARR